MNPYERAALNDAEEAVWQIAGDQAEQEQTSGIRPPPQIEETESTLDGQLFGLDFGGQPLPEVFPSSTSGGGPRTITITFVDITLCPDYLYLPDPNGTYTLTETTPGPGFTAFTAVWPSPGPYHFHITVKHFTVANKWTVDF